MLVLDARIVLLAAFCSFATLTFSPCWGVGAAAIQSRSLSHGQFHDVISDRPSAQYVLPLPLQSKVKQSKVRTPMMALFANIAFTPLKLDHTPAFTRERGDPGNIAHRSVLISNNHGSEYVVSHSRRPVHKHRRRRNVRMLNEVEEGSLSESRRAQEQIVGNVALMSTNQLLAMLFAAPDGPQSWTLYASEGNKTQFYLVPVGVESTSNPKFVTLEMGAPGETRTCATYNSSPPEDESSTKDENMTMEPCHDRATPGTAHKSQLFMYDGISGQLQPTENSDADRSSAAAVNSPFNQDSTTVSLNATTSSSAVQAATTLLANREDMTQNSRKHNSTVTLVFIPMKAVVADVATRRGYTMTMTKTVTVFNVESTTSAEVSSSLLNTASPQETSSALDVELVGAPMSSIGSTTAELASASTPFSTATSTIDAAAIASGIATSASSASASASSASAAAGSITVSSTTISSTNVSPSSTEAAQRRAYKKSAASDSKVNTISTEPYTWKF